jgi:hypothetical protein
MQILTRRIWSEAELPHPGNAGQLYDRKPTSNALAAKEFLRPSLLGPMRVLAERGAA